MGQARRAPEEGPRRGKSEVMSGFNIVVHWTTALVEDSGDPYYYPGKFTRYFRQKYCVPTVYRWRVLKGQPGEKETIYIGEAGNLIERIPSVLKPGASRKDSDTNKRLHQIFENCLGGNQQIVIDLAMIEPFEINGVHFDQRGLGNPFKRQALENLLLAFSQASGEFELLNVHIDQIDKVLSAFVEPHKVPALRRALGLEENS